jgi:tetratricopeptide (TPR) repeat protein
MKCLFGLLAIFTMATLPVHGAGSGSAGMSGQPVVREESPAVTAYNDGVKLLQAKQYQQAQAKFEEAVKRDPRFAEAHNNLAFTLRKQSAANFPQSLQHYNTAIQLKPGLAQAYEYRGVLYAQMGRRSDALADLAKLRTLNPKLAQELDQYLKTGKEDNDSYGTTKSVSN